MRGQMMAFPLTIPALLRRTASVWRDKLVITRQADRTITRTGYRTTIERASRLAVALKRAGIQPGDRVATFCWNHQQHLEAYFGIPMAGAVLHTLNLRLAPSDLGYIVDHAEDSAIIVDTSLATPFAAFRERVPGKLVIAVGAGERPRGSIDYEDFIANASADDFVDEVSDENTAAAMCYTSGTTGRPKGVLYSHRSLCLHSLVAGAAFQFQERDTVLPIVPMFHANAWGLPFTCAMLGMNIVLPGPHLDPESILDLMDSERVTFTAGVPTIWSGLARALEANPRRWDLSHMRGGLCGGSAVPPSMLQTFYERYGIWITQGWGLTETSPLATVANVDACFEGLEPAQRYTLGSKQGWAVPFIDLRIMTPDGPAPCDGKTMGEIEVRGPWVVAAYYKDESPDRFSDDGWFRTGDIATMDETGCIHIQDRAKDLIKSGGEWISSVALESALAGHPAVADVAVIATAHPHWQERPLALVVRKPNASATADDLRGFLGEQFPKWWLPDAVEFVDALPRTPTGKLLKYALREQYRNHLLRAEEV